MNVIVLENEDEFSNLDQKIIFHNTRDILDYFNGKGYTVSLSVIGNDIEVKLRSEFGTVAEYSGYWCKFVK
jgi:hypothetical protein